MRPDCTFNPDRLPLTCIPRIPGRVRVWKDIRIPLFLLGPRRTFVLVVDGLAFMLVARGHPACIFDS